MKNEQWFGMVNSNGAYFEMPYIIEDFHKGKRFTRASLYLTIEFMPDTLTST